VLLAAVLVYFLAPLRTELLVLGIDRAPEGTFLGRSDTIILVGVSPLKPDVRMLSIPRDLWVTVPGYGENRINTPHFFAEAEQEGSGPAAAQQAIEENFGVRMPYYLRIRFDAFTRVVEALGGIDLDLAETMAGYPAGRHHLNGDQALAFARDRAGTDDFFRMANGQYLIKAAARQVLKPKTWLRLPAAAAAFFQVMDTNLPAWQWPRLAVALLRAGASGIDNRTLTRDMVTPFTTNQGANVLLPNWEAINPVVEEMFGR
jgi:LCP family protein required for cell wall assembly